MTGSERSKGALLGEDGKMAGGSDIVLAISHQYHQKSRDESVQHQDKHRGGHHGLSSGSAYTLRPPLCSQSVVTADGCDDEAKNYWLQQAHEHVFEDQCLVGVAPVLVGVQAEQKLRDEGASGQADQVRNDSQKKQHEDGRDDARD